MQQQVDWLSVFQFGLSAVTALFSLTASLGLTLLGVGSLLLPLPGSEQTQSLSLLMLAGGSGFAGLVLLTSAWYAFQNVSGNKDQALSPLQSLPAPWIWLVLLGLTILGGYGVTSFGAPLTYFLPVFHVGAVVLTAVFFFTLGSRRLSIGSRQRFWGVLASGLVLGPILILLVEMVLLVLFLVAAITNLAAVPGLMEQLAEILERMPASPQAAEQLLETLGPYLANPLVIYAAFAFAAGLVPLIEELFKPIGIWLIFNRRLLPAQGFVAGMLSGAAYGLFESLALTINDQSWVVVILSRSGTTLIHIFTAGLVGWALALAFGRGQFVKLGLAYLAAVLVHGLWNGFTLLTVLSEFNNGYGVEVSSTLLTISRLAPYGLVALALLSLGSLLALNVRFARKLSETKPNDYNESFAVTDSSASAQNQESREISR